MQMPILIVSLAAMALVAWFFVGAVRASGAGAQGGAGTEKARSRLIWGLLIVGIAVTAASLRPWPHDVSADAGTVAVNVTGAQWSWEIDRETVPLGKTVVFSVHTRDVNHGMGVFDEAGTLLVQIQGMPGYVNQVRYVFERPGTYRVLCLEFCGVAHHEMNGSFDVVAGEG